MIGMLGSWLRRECVFYKFNLTHSLVALSQGNSSRYVERITAEQAAIQTQLVEVHGMEVINTGLRNTRIVDDDEEDVEMKSEPPMSKAIDAKQRALAKFVSWMVVLIHRRLVYLLVYLLARVLLRVHHISECSV